MAERGNLGGKPASPFKPHTQKKDGPVAPYKTATKNKGQS